MTTPALDQRLVGRERAAREPAGPILVVNHLEKWFDGPGQAPNKVLHDVSFAIAEGEFVSLIGPSGCGKSTLLEIIAGLQSASTGELTMDGRPITAPGPDRTIVFQHYALFPWRTALQNVMFPLEIMGIPRRQRTERARELLRIVQLHHAEDRYASQLSGGMQQRLGLARALACDARLLLMDEPFSGADAIIRETLQDLLHRLHVELRQTVLFVTHSVDEAMRLSDRIVVLGTQPGRIVSVVERAPCGHDSHQDDPSVRRHIAALLRREMRDAPGVADEADAVT